MKLQLPVGITSQRIAVFIQDSSSTTGAGLTGLVYNSAGLTWYRAREDDGNAGGTAITLATMTRGTWSTGGFVEKDATNLPGFYELGIPDNALALGSRWCAMMLKGATDMVPLPIEVQLEWQAVYFGAVTGSATTTGFADSGLPTRDNDNWRGRVILFLTGSLTGQARFIRTYTNSTKTFVTDTWTQAMSNGDKYAIY